MLQRIFVFFILLFFNIDSIAANFYQCESSDGKTSFSDKPCPTKSKTTNTGKLNSSRLSGTIGKKEFIDKNLASDPQTALVFRAKFSNILQSLTPLRLSIAQYYMDRGQWPKDLKALGIKPQAMNSMLIASTRIKNNGKIVALLKPILGENKMIILKPTPAMDNTTLDWKCSSNFPSTLLGGDELALCYSREIY